MLKLFMLFFIWIFLGLGEQKYISVKTIEEQCIRISAINCDSKEIFLKFQIHETKIDLIRFSRSQTINSLRQNQGIYKIVHIDDHEYLSIIENHDGSDKKLLSFKTINQLEDIFHIYDTEHKTRLSLRIKNCNYNQILFMRVSISAIVTLNNPSKDSLSPDQDMNQLKNYYSFRMDPPYNNYMYAAEKKYFCDTDTLPMCTIKVIKAYELKKTDGTPITMMDDIFEAYHLDIIHKTESETNTVRYKHLSERILHTSDFPVVDNIQCDITCQNGKTCQFETEKHLFNARCSCGDYFYGIHCEHKYYCSNCAENKCKKDNKCDKCLEGWIGSSCDKRSCKYLNMCGSNGVCKDSTTENECICNPNWSGKYCTIYTAPVKQTVEEPAKESHAEESKPDTKDTIPSVGRPVEEITYKPVTGDSLTSSPDSVEERESKPDASASVSDSIQKVVPKPDTTGDQNQPNIEKINDTKDSLEIPTKETERANAFTPDAQSTAIEQIEKKEADRLEVKSSNTKIVVGVVLGSIVAIVLIAGTVVYAIKQKE